MRSVQARAPGPVGKAPARSAMKTNSREVRWRPVPGTIRSSPSLRDARTLNRDLCSRGRGDIYQNKALQPRNVSKITAWLLNEINGACPGRCAGFCCPPAARPVLAHGTGRPESVLAQGIEQT
ncbi:hypothetical protein NDU88_000203 [Pleurodeles waltl]|uniref:Uncharacterized protein n=1 Tax=Pleurodeles waltl TaxID=8319 RepID=A0AAV7R625_PLEWA|nr:hypothetical protein NDU88_000203 [Pleurodeles waltl]